MDVFRQLVSHVVKVRRKDNLPKQMRKNKTVLLTTSVVIPVCRVRLRVRTANLYKIS